MRHGPLVLVGLSLVACAGSHSDEHVPVTSIQMPLIAEAVRGYVAELGNPPPGDSRAIFRALRGENPRGVAFLRSRRGEHADELLDPWGTSYDVAVLPGGTVRVRSAGPNGTLGDADDREIIEPLKRDALR